MEGMKILLLSIKNEVCQKINKCDPDNEDRMKINVFYINRIKMWKVSIFIRDDVAQPYTDNHGKWNICRW